MLLQTSPDARPTAKEALSYQEKNVSPKLPLFPSHEQLLDLLESNRRLIPSVLLSVTFPLGFEQQF